jgi:hypothetical protein
MRRAIQLHCTHNSRFFVNLPSEELSSFDRLFFHLQEASWFYSGIPCFFLQCLGSENYVRLHH